MEDPKLPEAEEKSRWAQQRERAARVESWKTRKPAVRSRVLAFLASLYWGRTLGTYGVIFIDTAAMNHSAPEGFEVHTGLDWLPPLLILVLLAAPVFLWRSIPTVRVFSREALLGAAAGLALAVLVLI